MRTLVINTGSSSIKYRLYDMAREAPLVSGILERIGERESLISHRAHTGAGGVRELKKTVDARDHAAGLAEVLALLRGGGATEADTTPELVGHRVVHGGVTFKAPTLIDGQVMDAIRAMVPLAPLHNPANLAGIEAARRLWPEVPQVAVFDTAFFQTLPAAAYRYAVPEGLYRDHGVRRYGFHGISHQQAATEAAALMGRPLETVRLITLHLGNGASAAAIDAGRCVDTSMGLTPLEGLIMGTRCGDLDPSIPFHLARILGSGLEEIEHLLNHDSGLKGLCGAGDMREVHRLAERGDTQARLALEMYCYRIRKYIGAYHAVLGGLDGLVFTAGIGEHDAAIRQAICEGLGVLGIRVDAALNRDQGDGAFVIHAKDSPVQVLVVPADEELAIARAALGLMQ